MKATPSLSSPARDPGLCVCGHAHAAHEHYRQGSECSLCEECPAYRPLRWPRRWWRRLLGRG